MGGRPQAIENGRHWLGLDLSRKRPPPPPDTARPRQGRERRSGGSNLLALPFTDGVTPTRLSLSDRLSEDQWLEVGRALGRVRSASQWWVGDWWAFGEHAYGERKAIVESEDWEGPAFQTCKNAATVCRSFETSRRRDVLSFSAHLEVISLPEDWQDKILEEAATDGHSVRQIRDRVKQTRAILAQGWTPDQLDRKARCEAGECVVANIHTDATGRRVDEALLAWAEMEDRFVRIDRKTDWGNPFEMPGDGDRAEVVGNFTKFYLPHKPSLLRRMPTLEGKVAGCWCHPEECHGHVLAEVANRVCRGEDAWAVIDELAAARGQGGSGRRV
jgi:Domain of unknown function (DUF4326)